jgi:cardiolipin synthase
VCAFLVADDAFGRELLKRLERRAQEGIHVRLLIDGAGIWLARHPSFRTLRRAGGQVMQFHPLLSLHPLNLRNHRRLVLADHARLWAGGRNFASEYFCGEGTAAPWIDLSFDLTGPIAESAAYQFEMDWAQSHQTAPAPRGDAGAEEGPLAQFLPSGPDQPEDTAQILLVTACFRARHRLLAVTPYFVPDETLLTAIRLAAQRGVQVTLVLPAVSNHRLADFVRGRALRTLAAAGVDVRLVSQMVHAKAVVMDDELALCGSINLDVRSLLINYESAVAFYGESEIAWLAHWIKALAARGAPFSPERPSIWRDLAEGLLLVVAFQL